MPFAHHHDMVKAFPSNRANHPLGIRVLPWRARRNHLCLPLIGPIGEMGMTYWLEKAEEEEKRA